MIFEFARLRPARSRLMTVSANSPRFGADTVTGVKYAGAGGMFVLERTRTASLAQPLNSIIVKAARTAHDNSFSFRLFAGALFGFDTFRLRLL